MDDTTTPFVTATTALERMAALAVATAPGTIYLAAHLTPDDTAARLFLAAVYSIAIGAHLGFTGH